MIGNDKALQAHAVHQQGAQVFQTGIFNFVVLRNQTAQCNACKRVEQPQKRVKNLAADVIEVDVDAVRAGRGELSVQVAAAVVYAGIKTELACDVLAFGRAAGDANDATAFDLRNLAGDAANRAARSGHDHGLACLGHADVEQADPCGNAGHTHHAKRSRPGCQRRVHRAQ